MRRALPMCLVLLAVSTLGCRRRTAQGLATHNLAGIDIDLPAWTLVGQRPRWDNGMISLRSGKNALELTWERAADLDSGEGMAAVLAATTTANGNWSNVGAAVPTSVNGHPGFTIDARFDGKPARFTVWFCADDQRRFMMSSVGDLELHAPILASARCHRPSTGQKAPAFTKLVPPAAYVADLDKVDLRTWVNSAREQLVVVAPVPGDQRAQVNQLFAALGSYTANGTIAADQMAKSTETDAQGHIRDVYRWKASFDAAERWITLYQWHCDKTDETHVVLLVLASDRTGDEHAAALAATCH